MVKKALAFILRNNNSELLCFTHPIKNYKEVVRGTVEENEKPEQTIIRELEEESGIKESEILSINSLGELLFNIPGGHDGKGPLEEQTYYGFNIQLKEPERKSWTHIVKSDGIDNGHCYNFQWENYNDKLLDFINPFTKQFLEKYIDSI